MIKIKIKIMMMIIKMINGNKILPRRSGFDPRSSDEGFEVDTVELGQVFAKYFGVPFQFALHQLLHIH
jgi:hypothetical protein